MANITIQLGQIVYGAKINFKTGEGIVTWKMLALGSLTWSYDSATHQMVCSNIGDHIKSTSGIKCDRYATQEITSWAQLSNGSIARHPSDDYIIRVYDTAYTDAATFKTAMQNANAQLCYELATPTTIQLTPTQLTMLKGYNRLSSDGGGDITVEAYTGAAWGGDEA